MQTKITIILLVFWSSGGGGLEFFKHKKISVAEPLADPDPACFNWHAEYYQKPDVIAAALNKVVYPTIASCFNVTRCASKYTAPVPKRPSSVGSGNTFSIVLTHSLERPPRARFRPESLWGFTQWQKKGVDTVLVVPSCDNPTRKKESGKEHAYCADEGTNRFNVPGRGGNYGIFPLTADERDFLGKHNIVIKEVAWALPPGLSYCYGCAIKDLIRLHAFSLLEYAAVAYFDFDVTLVGDLLPLLQCAATGEFMMTEGSFMSPLNAGMMALQPSKELFEMNLWYAKHAVYTDNITDFKNFKGGWDGGGAIPGYWPFPGLGCGQGYLWTLMYGSGLGRENGPSPLAREAAVKFIPTHKPARLVDRCIWNYQREDADDKKRMCRPDFKCNQVVAMHKAYEQEHNIAESATVCWRHQVSEP